MLQNKVKKRIKERKWDTYSNKAKFFSDVDTHVKSAFEDFSLIMNHFPQDKFQKIFTLERIGKCVNSLLEPIRYKELLEKKRKYKLDEKENNQLKNYEELLLNYCLLLLKISLVRVEKYIDDPFALELFQQHNKPLYNTIDKYFDQQLSTIDNQGKFKFQ